MKKTLLISAMLFSSSLYADDKIVRSNWGGEFRSGYQYTNDSVDTNDEFGLSTHIKYESSSWNNLVFGTRIVAVAGEGKEPYSIPFFDANNDGYGIVDELYVKGNFGNSELAIGRQAIDLPFVDTDEGLGLIGNRFEAILFSNKEIKDTIITLAHVRSWSGVDSDNPSKFNRINGNDGLQLAGIEYAGIENLDLKAFKYMAKGFINALYLEATYENETDLFEYSTTAQYALQDYDDKTKASIFGLGAKLELKNIPLGFNLAYNKNFDDGVADNLFGGGPFVSKMEHYTIVEAEGKGQMLKGGLSYEPMKVLSFEVNYAKIDRYIDADAKELDFGISYEFNDNLGANAIYSDINDERDGNQRNLRIFADYSF